MICELTIIASAWTAAGPPAEACLPVTQAEAAVSDSQTPEEMRSRRSPFAPPARSPYAPPPRS